ncbi:MAG TPA: 4Fe-4S binding protein, partial [Desulfuromonadales bacterium]|nr:4Fe-4S binding protein [Desulfuromonadales bacterium]
MFGFRYLEDVVTLALDRQLCIGCRRCVEVCPHQVLAM